MAHRTKNKGPGWTDNGWSRLRIDRRRQRNKIARLSKRANRETNR